MGGHGAIFCGLRNPDLFHSISAFAPITNPINTAWGKKAWEGYLGEENKDKWAIYDSCEVAKGYGGPSREILIDQVKPQVEYILSILKITTVQAVRLLIPSYLSIHIHREEMMNFSSRC
jgi:S-formylglutathione hydrolase FrmB